MRVLILVAAMLAVATAAPRTPDMVCDEEFISQLNAINETTFKASCSDYFKDTPMHKAQQLLGLRMDGQQNAVLPVLEHDVAVEDIPDAFDARTQWPKYIHPIRDQAQCGSCWAFSAAEVLSDRFTIATQGKTDVVLSPEDLVSCDSGDMGCQGGYLEHAWQYLDGTGIVSDKCFPYGAQTGTPPACATKCASSTETWTKYKAKDMYQLKTEKDIQAEIMASGPVQTGFTVYKSFMNYKSGVYQHHWWAFWDSVLGGHAVKIVGWGSEGKTPYWIVANSWTTNWGEDGYFRIARGGGSKNGNMEAQVFAGHAAI